MEIKQFSITNHHVKALVYGASGSGKTTFAGTARKAIFASAEAGLMSIADKKPSFVEIKSLKDLTDLLQYLQTQKHSYETVVIDSISEINEIIKIEIEKRTGKSMQLQDWGTLAKQIRTILRGFRDLPMHVLFLAQESSESDEQKIVKVVPQLNGKAATEVAYFMDIVGYLKIEPDGSRHMITEPNAKLLTKDRSNVIGNECEVDFGVWMDRIAKIQVSEQKVQETYNADPIEFVNGKQVSGPPVTPKPVEPQKPAAPKPPPPPKPLFPREEGDVMLSKEQMAEIKTLWPQLMEHQNAPVEERDALLQKSLMSKYGVKTLSYLRSKQAAHMIEGLNAALKKPELPLPQAA